MRIVNGEDSKADTDMRSMFPQLVYISAKTEQPTRPDDPTRLHIELYKPIELDDLAPLASPIRDFWHYSDTIYHPQPTRKQLLQDMKTLLIRRGGSLLFSRVANESRAKRLARMNEHPELTRKGVEDPSLTLHFERTVPEDVVPTLRALYRVLKRTPDLMDEQPTSMNQDHVGRRRGASDFSAYLKCNVDILETLLNNGASLDKVSLH